MKWRDIKGDYRDRIDALRSELSRDPYAILGVGPQATDEEVKRAYRHKVRAYHPDGKDTFVRAHAEEVMKIVNAAYDRIFQLRSRQ